MARLKKTLTSRRALPTYLAQSKGNEKTLSTAPSLALLLARGNVLKNTNEEISDERYLEEARLQQFESGQSEQQWEPKPQGVFRYLLRNVEELYLSGGGAAGRSYPAAFAQAAQYGLDLSKIKVVNATSVGAMQGLMVALNYSAHEMKECLVKMPAHQYQDWTFRSWFSIFSRLGLCHGRVMEDHFREVIREKTGLNDPTFQELYNTGYTKKLRIITTNVSRHQMAIFSYETTPNVRVAQIVGLACRVPLLFEPLWLPNERGELEAYTDGGLIQNYPWGISSDPELPLKSQLGFMFTNETETRAPLNTPRLSIWRRFLNYVISLIRISFFPNPMSLSEGVKQRTVKIKVVPEHNPLNFSATTHEQMRLDNAGRQGVNLFAKELIEQKKKKVKSTLRSTSNVGPSVANDAIMPSATYIINRHRLNNSPTKSMIGPSSSRLKV